MRAEPDPHQAVVPANTVAAASPEKQSSHQKSSVRVRVLLPVRGQLRQAKPAAAASSITFTLNGTPVTVENPDPSMTYSFFF
jgi:P pilus assembly chaperone PapD